MSRSAADATRFTATGPYVSSKAPYQLPSSVASKQSPASQPSASSTSPNSPKQSFPSSSSPPGETPRQKVERLRAQARAAKLAQSVSTFDRIINRGRRVANSAHKVMIYTLITASGVCGALTIYSVVSLTMWNRRQREIWLDRQLQDLQAAREAYVKGTASPEQLEILKNEKIGEIEKKLKKEADEQKLWNRTKRFLFQGLKKEDTPGAVVNSNSGAVEGAASSSYGILEAVNAKRAEETTSSSQTQHITSPQQIHPGALDVLASNAETTAKQSVKSWTSWVWGR